MILKYAMFTLTVSFIPIVMIVRDLTTSCKILEYIKSCESVTGIELINDILSSGVFTYFSYIFSSKNDNTVRSESPVATIFTKDMLQKCTGKKSKDLYLAILGNVFDVSKGAKYYGPGESYNAFTGRDGSRAFVTGDFTESGLIDDVEDLSLEELQSLNDWLKFYHKEYIFKGKLVGKYYDDNGNPTRYNYKLQLQIEEAERNKNNENKHKLMYPPCNVEWTPEEGSRVWCSQRSGGVVRDWVGVPRKLYEPGAETFRCACINISDQSQDVVPDNKKIRAGNLEEYEDCHPKSTSCYVHN